MNIKQMKISDIKPYEKNAKKHGQTQIDNVAESIKQFGFAQPLVVDKDGVLIIGHCRLLAAKKLKLREVPAVCMDELAPEQVDKLRLLDNKLNESEWDFELLADEIPDLDFDGFEIDWEIPSLDEETMTADEIERKKKEFEEKMKAGEISEEDEEYQEFLAKFELKKTTDDCYTPPIVFDAIAEWVAKEYKIGQEHFIRPFYPGGDYVHEEYPKDCVVVDNPPFSILAEIIRFYQSNDIKFFLFAPALTLFTGGDKICKIGAGANVTYENGANVCTSFLTNLEDAKIKSSPSLYDIIEKANNENLKNIRKQFPKYSYPKYVLTSTMLNIFSKYGVDFEVDIESCKKIHELQEMKKAGKCIYGSGYLLSEKAAAEKAAAEKAAAEKAAAEKKDVLIWHLSDAEMAIVKALK